MTERKLQVKNRDVKVRIPYQHYQQGNGKIRLNLNNQIIWLPEGVKMKNKDGWLEFTILRTVAERLELTSYIVDDSETQERRHWLALFRIGAEKYPEDFKRIAEEYGLKPA